MRLGVINLSQSCPFWQAHMRTKIIAFVWIVEMNAESYSLKEELDS